MAPHQSCQAASSRVQQPLFWPARPPMALRRNSCDSDSGNTAMTIVPIRSPLVLQSGSSHRGFLGLEELYSYSS